MPQVLKVLQLAQQDRVTEMQIWCGRIESGFDEKRLAGGAGFLELFAKLGLLDDFRGTFLDVGQLFVDRGEGGHLTIIIRNEEVRRHNVEVKSCLTRFCGA